MDFTVRVCGLIGREGRSRVNVVKLALGSYPQNGTLVVDFQGWISCHGRLPMKLFHKLKAGSTR